LQVLVLVSGLFFSLFDRLVLSRLGNAISLTCMVLPRFFFFPSQTFPVDVCGDFFAGFEEI